MALWKYTGANGLASSFSAETGAEALKRLERLPGYVDRNADGLTAALLNSQQMKSALNRNASALNMTDAARMALNASRTFPQNAVGNRNTTVTVVTGAHYDDNRGLVLEVSELTFPVTVSVASKRTVVIPNAAQSAGGANGGSGASGSSASSGSAAADEKTSLSVVVGSFYDAKSHKFTNQLVTISGVKVGNASVAEVFEAVEETVSEERAGEG